MDIKSISIVIIQQWWRKYTQISQLKNVLDQIIYNISITDLQQLVNKCNSICLTCSGDGGGLASGYLIDMLICELFTQKIPKCYINHYGESDITIHNINFSFKKINGKSTIALDWSKNPRTCNKTYFEHHFLIINLKSEKWWKCNPIKSSITYSIIFSDLIPDGLYLIDKLFCKYYVKLNSNNKTNALINSQYLYAMLKRSIQLKLYILLPQVSENLVFRISDAFIN